MNSVHWNWLGWISNNPVTEDYVPLFPWLGVMCWGAAFGSWVLKQRPEWLVQPVPKALHVLARLGRWSLSYYLMHQPVLIFFVSGVSWILL